MRVSLPRPPALITAAGVDLDICRQNRYAICIAVIQILEVSMDQAPRTPKSDTDSRNDAERWADREKKRRKAWLDGPSEEEKQEWLERHSRRREYDNSSEDEDIEEGRRIAGRWERDIGWAVTGLVSRLMDSRYALLGNLVREGREAEDHYLASRRRRKRVFSDDDV